MTLHTITPLLNGVARKIVFSGAFAAVLMLGGVAASDAFANEYSAARPVVVKEVVVSETIAYRPAMAAQPAYGPHDNRIDYGASCYSSGFHTPDPSVGMGMGVSGTPGFAVAVPMQTGVGRASIPADFERDGPNHLRQQSRSERLPAPIKPLHMQRY